MNNDQPQKQTASDEIDLGVLFSKIKGGFNRLGNALLRGVLSFYLYLKANIFWLGGILVLGSSTGLLIEFKFGKTYELNAIVKPSLDAKNYLYTAVADLNANIKAKDTAFFAALGMDIERMKGFDVEVVSLKAENNEKLKTELEFLSFLKESGIGELAEQLTNSIVEDRTTQEQIITFYFKDSEIGEAYAQKLLDYLNDNPYYNNLEQVLISNAEARILRNAELIGQVDGLLENYTRMMVEQQPTTSGSLVLENKEPLNVPSLFALKNELIKDTESKQIELENREGPVMVISFGKTREADIPFVFKTAVIIPILLLLLFFGISILSVINRKAEEMTKKQ